jgi:hypothetical protein
VGSVIGRRAPLGHSARTSDVRPSDDLESLDDAPLVVGPRETSDGFSRLTE